MENTGYVVNAGREPVTYESLKPTIGIHWFVFVLFKQMGRKTVYPPGSRQNFNTKNFADRNGLGLPVAVVFDEVQCGLGRTGHLWAHQAYDVQPDMMTLAKPLAGGLPIGAVLVTEKVAAAIGPGDHGSTFAGGPLVCHAALAVLNRIQEAGFLENVARKGQYLKGLLAKKLGGNVHVKEIRGSGLLVGIELDVSASSLAEAALSAGLVILTAGKGNIVRLVPPLIISEAELEQAVDILSKCIPILD